jgi:hypothetical protein
LDTARGANARAGAPPGGAEAAHAPSPRGDPFLRTLAPGPGRARETDLRARRFLLWGDPIPGRRGLQLPGPRSQSLPPKFRILPSSLGGVENGQGHTPARSCSVTLKVWSWGCTRRSRAQALFRCTAELKERRVPRGEHERAQAQPEVDIVPKINRERLYVVLPRSRNCRRDFWERWAEPWIRGEGSWGPRGPRSGAHGAVGRPKDVSAVGHMP